MQLISAAQDLDRCLESAISVESVLAHDEKEEAPVEAFAALREWGVHAHLVPRAFGGRMGSWEEMLALVRVLSRRDLVLTTGLGSTMLAAIPVWVWGSDAQRREVAGLLLNEGAFGSFAVSERDAGSDFAATRTRLEGTVLRGEKWMIGNASRSSFVVALARTRERLSLVYLRPDGSVRRLPRIRTLGLRGHDLGGLHFDDVRLPADAVLQPEGRGMEMAMTTLNFTRTMVGGMALGAADTALRLAREWARERRLYGAPIAEIPAVRKLLGEVERDIATAECVATVTARALTMAPRRATLWAAAAKYVVPKLCERAVRGAGAVLSARSYLRDGLFQKIARDVAIASIFEGTSLVQHSLIDSQLKRLRPDGEPVDVDRLCDLSVPAPAWDPATVRLRVADPGGDELVERWFGPSRDLDPEEYCRRFAVACSRGLP